jgi:hypothetical protein
LSSSKHDDAQAENLPRLGVDNEHSHTDLDWREQRVLEAFKQKKTLCYSDLPYMVGRKTMDGLVKRGLVSEGTSRAGKYSKDFEWTRK